MKIKTISALLVIALLVSCGKKKEEPSVVIRPVKVAKVESRSEITKDFSGVVEAVNFVNLAFRVTGQIINLPIIEGQRVKKGDLIAELDTREIALKYSADKANYETASSQLERAKRLVAKQAISQQEYEITQTKFEQAKSAFEASSNNMRDTKLYAPFAGSIEERMVENYQRVMPGASIIKLINTSDLQIGFTVPDNTLHLLQNNPTFIVEFDIYKGYRFFAKLKEFVDASPDGSGIPVTITIDDPKFKETNLDIKPGFACNVTMNVKMPDLTNTGSAYVPLTAIYADPVSKQKTVWVVDSNNTVHMRPVVTGNLFGESYITITKGVEVGETIVTAGVTQITDGEKIKILN